ncbi:helix-turn-helix domain-containing protein [Streptomyces sp. NPDC097981]|uniref:helix-turn-helix domain-containing protein n=1 Tax=Streptomyces sp. NPDC097981 TaxID=3155428 RepID=UPI00331E083B
MGAHGFVWRTRSRRQFLDHLRAGMATTKAAAEVGITTATVYQRRRRDTGFAAAMDQATATRITPELASAATDAQWTAFYNHLATHGVLRQAALAAGIRPESVYDRRRTDTDFAKRTDRLRARRE